MVGPLPKHGEVHMRNEYRVCKHWRKGLFTWQIRYWWLPFIWFDPNDTYMSIEQAEQGAMKHASDKKEGIVLKVLGRLP